MKKVLTYFLSSISVTLLSVIVVFISSVKLEAKIFSEIVYFLYLIPLILELSIFGQHYSILKNAHKNKVSNLWKLDRRKLYLSAMICCVLVFNIISDIENAALLLLTTLMIISLWMTSAFLRVNGKLLMSVVTGRFIQIMVSIVLVIFMIFNNIDDYIYLILFTLTIFFYFIVLRRFRNNFPFVNSSMTGRTDTTYEINMFFTICSMLLVKSLDKIIISNYFTPYEFSKFVILFQLYLPFPVLAGFIFQYYMPKFASQSSISYNKLYSGLFVIFCFFLWYFISEISYWIYTQVYSGKYDFSLHEIRAFIGAGFLFVLYQPLALVIVSISKNSNLFTLNMLNIISIGAYAYFITISIQENTLDYVIAGFLCFWVIKLFSGVIIINKIKNFKWG